MLKQGISVSHQLNPAIKGKILCPAGDGFYYVATQPNVFAISEEQILVTDEKSRLSNEEQIYYAKYLNAGSENARGGVLTNANSGVPTSRPLKSNPTVLYADSELNVSRSAYSGMYLVTVNNARIANRINKVTQTYLGYVIRDDDEPQFHLNEAQLSDAIKEMGKVRGEKVYAAIRGSK